MMDWKLRVGVFTVLIEVTIGGVRIQPGNYFQAEIGRKRGLYEIVDGYPGRLIVQWEE